MIICMYTDDTTGSLLDKKEVEREKKKLYEHYNIQIIKKVNHMLEIKVERIKDKIQISQKAYIYHMLEKFDMVSCKPRLTPLPVGIMFFSSDGLKTDEEKEEMKKVLY